MPTPEPPPAWQPLSMSTWLSSSSRESRATSCRAYRENRIERLKEIVLSELSGTVAPLLREDYERLLESASRHEVAAKTQRKRPIKR